MGNLRITIDTDDISINLESNIPSYPSSDVNHQRVIDELDLAYERAKRMVMASRTPKGPLDV